MEKKYTGYASKAYARKVAAKMEACDGVAREVRANPNGGWKVYFA